MSRSYPGFNEFEHAGWEDEQVVAHYERELADLTGQSASALLDAGGVVGGSRVLDVACGPGLLTAGAAARGANALGIDFSSAQVAAARHRFPNLRFEVGDASRLPVEAASFDAVVCSFGMLHFPDARAAAFEAYRVLVNGGRFAFSVWDLPERSVAMGALLRAMRAHGELNVALPEGPDFFALSTPERSLQLLIDAGFEGARTERVLQVWRVPSPEHVFDVLQRATVRMRALLRAQTAQQATKIRAALHQELAAYRRGELYEVPMAALLYSGRKPG